MIFQLENDNVLIGNTWTGGEGESEGESVDSEGEDNLQLAGVYTVEEVSEGESLKAVGAHLSPFETKPGIRPKKVTALKFQGM